MKNLKKFELNMENNYNHRARCDYNAEFLYSPLKIILNVNIINN